MASVSVPDAGVYGEGQNLDFAINFDEAVTVNSINGTPSIAVTVGNTSNTASYFSGAGSTALVFRYTVVSGDNDTDGVAVSATSISLNSGTIQDLIGERCRFNTQQPRFHFVCLG